MGNEAEPWRAEVTVYEGSEHGLRWYCNELRFATREEALDYAGNLASRWTSVTRYRAVDDSVPSHQEYEPGSEDKSFI